MTLSDELAMRRSPPRVAWPARSRLSEQVRELEALYGGAAQIPSPPPDWVAAARTALDAGPAAVAALERGPLRAVPYVLWSRADWVGDGNLMRAFLGRTDHVWPTAPRYLWRHHLLNLAPATAASAWLGAWLGRQRLPERLLDFSARYTLFEPERAIGTLTARALDPDILLEDLKAVGISREALAESTLLATLLRRIGQRLETYAPADWLVRMRKLLGDPPARAPAHQSADYASLLSGIIRRQRRDDPADAYPDAVLAFVVALNDDPRFSRPRWDGVVAPELTAIVEGWLTRKAIEAFFSVIDAMRTDRPDMWRARKEFWLKYLPHIGRAWLIVGQDAHARVAGDRSLTYGTFAKGRGARADHCALMLRVGSLNVLEMNKDGRVLFWGDQARDMPDMFERATPYVRQRFLDAVDGVGVVGIPHQGAWQRRFAQHIAEKTGIVVTP
jgi:hypothetical protein